MQRAQGQRRAAGATAGATGCVVLALALQGPHVASQRVTACRGAHTPTALQPPVAASWTPSCPSGPGRTGAPVDTSGSRDGSRARVPRAGVAMAR